MLDIAATELLVILIVAVVVIGPKDLPLAMRVAGRWIGKVRRMSAHFRSGIDAMVREAELEDMEKKWKAQNEEIMRRSAALTTAEADAAALPAEALPPVDQAAPITPVEPPPIPAAPPPDLPPPVPLPLPLDKPVKLATVTLGGPNVDAEPDPPLPPMLPARPHTGDGDV